MRRKEAKVGEGKKDPFTNESHVKLLLPFSLLATCRRSLVGRPTGHLLLLLLLLFLIHLRQQVLPNNGRFQPTACF